MLFTSILALAGLAFMAQTFALPAGLEDGIYFLTVNEAGEEVATLAERHASPVNEAFSPVHALQAREALGWNMHCGCNNYMNVANCNSAAEAIINFLNGYPHADEKGLISIEGSVVAFVCNNNAVKPSYSISGTTFKDMLNSITSSW